MSALPAKADMRLDLLQRVANDPKLTLGSVAGLGQNMSPDTANCCSHTHLID